MVKKVRVVGYVRVSTEEQAREGFSLENQRKDIKRLCEYKDWDLVESFDDEGISGSTIEERPGIIEALRFCKEEKVDYLIVWKLSRLSRKMSDLVQIADYLANNNIHLITIKDGIDTSTPMGKSFLYFAGIFAELERDSLITQVKGGMEQKAREGQWNGGRPPLGYDLVDKKLKINKEEEKIVKLIFKEYLGGSGYLAIVDALKEEGYKTKRGNDFSGNAVKDILRNPTYKGWVRWGYRKDWGKKDGNGRRKRKYNENPIYVKGIHKHIIKPEVFDQVQGLIKKNPRSHMRRFQGFHLLSGLLKCPICGQGMSVQNVTSRGKKYSYYTCNQYQNKKTCQPNMIRKEEIEEDFLNILDKVVKEKTFRDTMLNSADSANIQIKEIEDKINRKERAIEKLKLDENKLLDELIEGTDSYKETIRRKIQEKINKGEELEKDIMEDRCKIKQLQSQTLDVGEILDILEETGKIIRVLDKDAQQKLIRKLIRQIQTKDKNISEIEFTFGDVLGLSEEQGTLS